MGGRASMALSQVIERVSKIMAIVSGVALTFVMVMTVLDVSGRTIGHPILGTYEIIAFAGTFLIGCSMALTSVSGSHVYMEFLVDRLPGGTRKVFNIVTKIICLMLFAVISVNLFKFAAELRRAGEVSATLNIPVYPFAYVFGVCCSIQCVVFVAAALRIWNSKGEGL